MCGFIFRYHQSFFWKVDDNLCSIDFASCYIPCFGQEPVFCALIHNLLLSKHLDKNKKLNFASVLLKLFFLLSSRLHIYLINNEINRFATWKVALCYVKSGTLLREKWHHLREKWHSAAWKVAPSKRKVAPAWKMAPFYLTQDLVCMVKVSLPPRSSN